MKLNSLVIECRTFYKQEDMNILQRDMLISLKSCLSLAFSVCIMQGVLLFLFLKIQGELPFDPEVKQPFADICFEVEGHRFMCHKVRSIYT